MALQSLPLPVATTTWQPPLTLSGIVRFYEVVRGSQVIVSVLVGSGVRISSCLRPLFCKDRKVNIRNKGERDKHENDNVCRSLC